MFFSIVIPTLNEEKYLPRLLQDLVKQSNQDFEVIVVDGKSDDKTVEGVEKFRTKIKKLKVLDSKKRNVAMQRNMGGKKAKGMWIVFMDADAQLPEFFLDEIKYQILETQAEAFTSLCKADRNNFHTKYIEWGMNLALIVTHLIKIPIAVGAMTGCKRSVFQKSGGYDKKLLYGEDTFFIRNLLDAGYRVKLFFRPKFIMSLRRFRHEKPLKLAGRYLMLSYKNFRNIKIDPEKDYPMGGHVFE